MTGYWPVIVNEIPVRISVKIVKNSDVVSFNDKILTGKVENKQKLLRT